MLRLAGRDQNRHPPDIFHLPRSQEIYHHQLWPTGDSTTTYYKDHRGNYHTAQQVLPSFILTTWWSTHTFSPSDLWLEAGCTVNQQLSFMAPAYGNTISHMHYMATTILLWPTFVWLLWEANIISQFVRGGRGWETTKQLQEPMQTVSMM